MTLLPSFDRDALAARYLSLLESLTLEINAGLSALVKRSIHEFRSHLAQQEQLCFELREITMILADRTSPSFSLPHLGGDSELSSRIFRATQELQTLNRTYGSFLRHSAQSGALLAAVCRSFQDRLRPVSGAMGQSTLSCEG